MLGVASQVTQPDGPQLDTFSNAIAGSNSGGQDPGSGRSGPGSEPKTEPEKGISNSKEWKINID